MDAARYDTALSFLQQSLVLMEESRDLQGLAAVNHSIGDLYIRTERPRKAIPYLKTSHEQASAIGARLQMVDASEGLQLAYAAIGEYKQAYEHQLDFVRWNDSIFNQDKSRMLMELTAQYEADAKDNEIQLLQKDKEIMDARLDKNRLLNLALFLGVILLAVVAAFLLIGYRNNRKKNQLLSEQNSRISAQKEQIEAQNEVLEDKNQELKELNEEKNYLVGVVAHDLQSPLSKIRGLASIIKREADYLSPPHRKFLEYMESSTAELSHMINRILDIESIESKRLHLVMETVDLREVIEYALEDFREEAQEKSIGINLGANGHPVLVRIDKEFSRHVFDNLISNALKYSPVNSEVLIDLEENGDTVRAKIRDQGPGIRKADIPKLFRKYQTLDTLPTHGESSTGLGLSIVKKYVEAMEGRVWCESEFGKGSTFIVEFEKAPSNN